MGRVRSCDTCGRGLVDYPADLTTCVLCRDEKAGRVSSAACDDPRFSPDDPETCLRCGWSDFSHPYDRLTVLNRQVMTPARVQP